VSAAKAVLGIDALESAKSAAAAAKPAAVLEVVNIIVSLRSEFAETASLLTRGLSGWLHISTNA
jgi:hypothetical protein